MTDDRYTVEDHSTEPRFDSGPEGARSRSAGAFFHGAQHFVVTGGRFTSNITNVPDVSPDFRRIPLGDLDLRHEICLDSGGVVSRRQGEPARRIYSARIEGKQSDMTVAVYEGQNAKEIWNRDLSKYSGIRHPNVLQLYGITASGGLYATVFHDELVPFERFMAEYQHSMIATVYLHAYFRRELRDVELYVGRLFGYTWSQDISIFDSPLWIRPSTVRLCVEPSASDVANPLEEALWICDYSPYVPHSAHGTNRDHIILSALAMTLDRYHEISFIQFANQTRGWPGSIPDAIHLGVVLLWPDQMREIAYIPDMPVRNSEWECHVWPENLPSIVTENGWTRFDSACAKHGRIERRLRPMAIWDQWLCQANYIFSQVLMTAPHDDYFFVWTIDYELTFSDLPEEIPEGYLFLCSLSDLQSEDGKFLECPECPAYWSLDSTGNDRLSPEKASALGFPTFEWKRTVSCKSWGSRVYASLGEFHAAKGFDPNSQDIARHLGQPLYELSITPNGGCARRSVLR
ncbi:hypothetical protein B0H11DRAFT_1394086 [Mycena galericulata]|nr:hypothetical protein B0H11DRAFT_665655 [Mycena galericulata]KAJ7469371.1 hypothetical protein B0H11DRAFT_1394086 [Mycena galericulata]